jgi:transcriptional activator of eps genes
MKYSADQINRFLASFSGCDGGNLNAEIWVCGIEPGGGFDPLNEGLEPDDVPFWWSAEYKRKWPRYTKLQYNQRVAKLMVLLGQIQENKAPELNDSEWRDYIKDKLYSNDGESLKLNLFPLSAPSTIDARWKDAYPALGDRANYQKLCQEHRFPFFTQKRKEQRPKVIIGTGVTYIHDFADAFGFPIERSKPFEIRSGDASRNCFRFTDAGSTLIVCPFFGGRYGVNSHGLLIDLAKHVAEAAA